MDFKSKYISTADKALDSKSAKTVLSDDAYAIGEMIEELKQEFFASSMRSR